MLKKYLALMCSGLLLTQSIVASDYSRAVENMVREGRILLQPIGSTAINVCRASKNVAVAGGRVILLTGKLGVQAVITLAKGCEHVSQFMVDHPDLVAGMLIGSGIMYAYGKYQKWSKQQAKDDLKRGIRSATRERRGLLDDLGVQHAII